MIRVRPIFSALHPSLALALTCMGPGSIAQAQTAQETHAQIAAPVEVATFEVHGTSLRTQYPDMVRQSGKVLTFAAAPDSNLVAERWGHFVLYAPLNRLWLLDEMDTVVEHAYIEVKQTPFDHLVLHWTHWLDRDISDSLPAAAQIPAFSVESTAPHPLAVQYDALLSKPLARALAPLPARAYFSVGGHVFDTAGAQIAEWDSYGPDILLRMRHAEESVSTPAVKPKTDTKSKAGNAVPDPTNPTANPRWQWFAVADLAAALNPEPPQGDH